MLESKYFIAIFALNVIQRLQFYNQDTNTMHVLRNI